MIDLADGSVRRARTVSETRLAMSVVDLNGRVLRWSKALADIYGVSEKDACGQIVWDIIPCMTKNGSCRKLEDAFRGLPANGLHWSAVPEKNLYAMTYHLRRPVYRDGRIIGAVNVVDWVRPVEPFAYGEEEGVAAPGVPRLIAAIMAFAMLAIDNLPWIHNIVEAATMAADLWEMVA